MSQFFEVHPQDPQPRLIRQAVEIVRRGGLVAYPTDSSYAVGCHLGDKAAMERIQRLRRLDDRHNFTLVCADLAEIATYAKVDNATYRLLKAHTPGPYTFILKATSEVPRRLQAGKRKTIGIRIPDHAVPRALVAELGEPVMSSTLLLPGADLPETDAWTLRERLEHELDVIIDAGACQAEPTSVVDLSGDGPEVLRRGRGDLAWLDL